MLLKQIIFAVRARGFIWRHGSYTPLPLQFIDCSPWLRTSCRSAAESAERSLS